jgi:ABC-type uncharacterized transport system permease subunit
MADILSIDLVIAGIRMMTPLLFMSVGGLYSEKAGVFALAMEGMMLCGCFGGFMGSYLSGSPWTGLLVALLVGVVVGILYAIVTVNLGCEQIIAALAINLLALGLTGALFRGYFGATTSQIEAPNLQPISIPGLSELPVIGPILFQHIVPVYVAIVLVFITQFVFYRTTMGLKIRAVGEKPVAADSLGVSVNRTRFLCVVISGALGAVGGGVVSIGYLNTFMEGMSAGRGYLAFAAIMFGNHTPAGVLLACFIFGVSYALGLRLQALGADVPYQFLSMLPYVVTLLALFTVRRSHAPSDIGFPYRKEEK